MLLFGMGRLFVRSVLQPTGGVIIGVWMFDGVSVGFNVCPSAYFTSAVTINSRYDFTVFGISSTVVDWLSKITVTSGVSIGSRDSIFGIVLLELAFSVSLLSFAFSYCSPMGIANFVLAEPAALLLLHLFVGFLLSSGFFDS